MSFVEYLIGIPLIFFVGALTLKKPYWGIILLFAILPVLDIFSFAPFLNYIFTVLGLFTLVGYITQPKNGGQRTIQSQFLFALLFILWITLTNPQAAIFSRDRNWLWTYIQLFVFMWLASKLLLPDRHKTLMQTYLYFAFVSAIVAIAQGRIGNSIFNTIRAEGLAGNANEEALYLIIAILFWFYLYINEYIHKSPVKRIFYLTIILTLVVGVFETVSRTGFIALVVGIFLTFVLANRFAAHKPVATRWMILLLIVGVAFLIPSGYWGILSNTQRSFLNNLRGTEQSGTFYLRLTYWRAALQMWSDAPITGQGIGQFRFLFNDYRDPGQRLRIAPAHNAFISLLAETGFVGLILYLLWIFSIFLSLWRESTKKLAYSSSAITWFVILFVFCVFLVSNNFEYLKVIWIVAGVSTTFTNSEHSSQNNKNPKEVVVVRHLRTSNL